MSAEDYSHYARRHIFYTIIPAFVAPVVVVSLSARFCFPTLSWYAVLGLQLLSIPLWNQIRVAYSDFTHARDAKRLGAEQVPRIIGKWPGNIDILIALNKAAKERYFQDYLLEQFEKYGTNTLNTRLLWTDQVRQLSFARF